MPPLQLREHVWRALQNAVRQSLTKLDSWDLDFVRERLLRKGYDQFHASDLVQEYRHYLALLVLSPGRSHTLAGPVDQVWHEHILHTREYDHFCYSVFGRFVHHSPSSLDDSPKTGGAYLDTVEELRLFFTDFAAHAWPDQSVTFCDSCRDIVPEEMLGASVFSQMH
jgi:hypothetical protein